MSEQYLEDNYIDTPDIIQYGGGKVRGEYPNEKICQTFTAENDYKLAKIRLLLCRIQSQDAYEGTLWLNLRSVTSEEKPGTILSSANINVSSIPVSDSYGQPQYDEYYWIEFVLNKSYSLSSDIQYAITLFASMEEYITIRWGASLSAGYSGGQYWHWDWVANKWGTYPYPEWEIWDHFFKCYRKESSVVQSRGAGFYDGIYNPSAVWGYNPDIENYEWMTTDEDIEVPHILAAGGGRYRKNIVVVGHNSVYYGET